MIRQEALPVDLEVLRYMRNSELSDRVSTLTLPSPPPDGGEGRVRERPEVSGTDTKQQVDTPAAYVEFKKKGTGESLGTYLVAILLNPQQLTVDGKTFTKDVILDRGALRKRKKKPSRAFREQFGHTPVSLQEDIPWGCKRLVIGTGMEGRLPVMDDVAAEARRRGIELVVRPTPEAVHLLQEHPADTNAILHVTC